MPHYSNRDQLRKSFFLHLTDLTQLWRLSGQGAFCRGDGQLRLTMVDTEPKVLQQLRREGLTVPHGCVHYEQSGRGNNWAYG